MLKEKQRLTESRQFIENKLKSYPDGKLICCTQDGRTKWYRSDGHKKIYIPKSNVELAEQLAQKKYFTYLLDDIKKEISAVDLYLKHHRPQSQKADKLLTEIPGYKDLLSPYFQPKSQKLAEWVSTPYESNQYHPGNLIHKTISGHLVRSKSESMIASLLYSNHIPFRYEAPLTINNHTIYPDFSIIHPHSCECYYWEHFGLMDDPSYCNKAIARIQLYSANGIIPTIHLITTYETQDNPLSISMIQNPIEYYFL